MDAKRKTKSQHFWTAAAIFCGVVIIPYYWIYARVDIYLDGKVIAVRSADRRIESILRYNKIQYGPLDLIQPDIGQRLKPGQGIRIVRVREEIIQTQDQVPYTVIAQSESKRNLRPVEVQDGFYGKRHGQVKVRYHDNREFSREIIKEKIEKKKVHKLILKNKKGQPVKEYDLGKTRFLWMTATTYYPYDPLCFPGGDGIHTRLGYTLERGLVAVDPRIIPLRTRLYIPGYGYAYAADTGSAIKGKRIDLAVNTQGESEKYGKRQVKVYILGRAPYW